MAERRAGQTWRNAGGLHLPRRPAALGGPGVVPAPAGRGRRRRAGPGSGGTGDGLRRHLVPRPPTRTRWSGTPDGPAGGGHGLRQGAGPWPAVGAGVSLRLERTAGAGRGAALLPVADLRGDGAGALPAAGGGGGPARRQDGLGHGRAADVRGPAGEPAAAPLPTIQIDAHAAFVLPTHPRRPQDDPDPHPGVDQEAAAGPRRVPPCGPARAARRCREGGCRRGRQSGGALFCSC